ncbi:hypothetical protein SAY86_021582 [Trapa natans]|uniref:Uncharacterized protein n=1 Tax=Trapa natans TaxID=22666 RepID=A0AAN7RFR2_TRANT|nr:hypothetical protein SAY86_021582 [Trapa natans]
MGHSNVWNSHPKNYGPGSRACKYSLQNAVFVAIPMQSSGSMVSCAADSVSVAMPRRSASSRKDEGRKPRNIGKAKEVKESNESERCEDSDFHFPSSAPLLRRRRPSIMVVASTAITDPIQPTPGPSRALRATQPPNRTAVSSAPSPIAHHPRKPKSKNVPSRYLSPSPSTPASNSSSTSTAAMASSLSSRRFTSPLLSRSTNTAAASPSTAPKRSQSADRRRPAAARPTTPIASGDSGGGEVSAAAKLLITSTRSLSVSFQGEAFSLPVSKTKKAATPERRRSTLTTVRDQAENSKPPDQHTPRWPSRARQANLSSNMDYSYRSVDYSRIADEKRRLIGFGSGNLSKLLLRQSMTEESGNSRRMSCDVRLSLDLGKVEFLKGIPQAPDANSLNESSPTCDLTASSDTDSLSSESTNGVQECGGISKPKGGTRGIVASARFWQETNTRLRRLQDPISPILASPGLPTGGGLNKLSQSKNSPLGSSRIMASPARGATRPASPSKVRAPSVSSPARGMPSPSRVRSNLGTLIGDSCSMPSILSFSMDVRRGKMGEDRIVEAHLLRLLYNRHLQWRFVNARADSAFSIQRLNAEKILWNAWVVISELRHNVTLKRMKLLLLRQKLKLTSILKGQADVHNLKDAIGSAMEVMQAMAYYICSFSMKLDRHTQGKSFGQQVEEINNLVTELKNVSAKERISLRQCRDFLSELAGMQLENTCITIASHAANSLRHLTGMMDTA